MNREMAKLMSQFDKLNYGAVSEVGLADGDLDRDVVAALKNRVTP